MNFVILYKYSIIILVNNPDWISISNNLFGLESKQLMFEYNFFYSFYKNVIERKKYNRELE